MASCWPPSVATDVPPVACGIRATANSPGHLRGRPVGEQRIGVRPVAHRDRAAALKGKTRLLFLPGEHIARDNPIAVDRVAHGGQRADAGIGVDDRAAGRVEEPTAEAVQVLEEHRDEPFVPRARPDEPERQAVFALRTRDGSRELVERRRRVRRASPSASTACRHRRTTAAHRAIPATGWPRSSQERTRWSAAESGRAAESIRRRRTRASRPRRAAARPAPKSARSATGRTADAAGRRRPAPIAAPRGRRGAAPRSSRVGGAGSRPRARRRCQRRSAHRRRRARRTPAGSRRSRARSTAALATQ